MILLASNRNEMVNGFQAVFLGWGKDCWPCLNLLIYFLFLFASKKFSVVRRHAGGGLIHNYTYTYTAILDNRAE